MGKSLKVLVACEESQAVCKAFRARGHEAYSCDIQECSGGRPEWHIKGDAIDALYSREWDLVIAHPPCDRLANSGVRWLHERRLYADLKDAIVFFREFQHYAGFGNMLCIENPIPHKYARDGFWINDYVINYPQPERIWGIGKQSQIVHPFQFGHMEQKSTCLWLYGLPELKETHNVHSEMMTLSYSERAKIHCAHPGKDRKKLRSKTYPGIARAMAAQWSEDLGFTNEETFLR